MVKARIYRKGRQVIGIYLSIVLLVMALIIRQIAVYMDMQAIQDGVKDAINKMRIELFVQSAFSLSPNLKCISNTKDSSGTDRLNMMMFITDSFMPYLTYIANTDITAYNYMVEIEPYLNAKEKDENAVEVFDTANIFKPVVQIQTATTVTAPYTLAQLSDYNFMLNKMYIVDANVIASQDLFDIPFFMGKDFGIDLKQDGPKILVYHTHSQEAFADSKVGEQGDTVVGVGDEFVRILEEDYGIETYHLRESFDLVEPSMAYERIEERLKQILKDNPSIQVCIDLHRDGIPENIKLETIIDGKSTANIMFFSGLSKKMSDGKMVDDLKKPNPYLKENMAFSFQMQLMAKELYPTLPRKIYLKAARYNLHNLPSSLLIEVGAQTNTVEEVKNAMAPLAKILYAVIQ